MKYFFISDVHGQYDKMIAALNEAHFNPNTDTLISLGDLFDRGDKSKEILEYVMNCPNRILVLGNHDSRLEEIIYGAKSNRYDVMNGVEETFKSFLNKSETPKIYWGREMFMHDNDYRDVKNLLLQYFDECVWAIEFKDLIGTHAWIPMIDDWRHANEWVWEQTIWSNTEKMITQKYYIEKPLIVGHWHTWRIAAKFGPHKQTISDDYDGNLDCNIIKIDGNIFIDGCANWPHGGKVNVYVYETEEVPTKYGTRKIF